MKHTKVAAWLLALLLALLPAISLAETYTMMGLEGSDAERDWNINRYFQTREEQTGISFIFHQYANADTYQAEKDRVFATGDLPDVFFKASLTPEEEMRYLQSGQLIDLAPLLEEYAPILHSILQARPDWLAVITQPDGGIASLPILNGADRQAVIWINRVWLETLGLSTPETIEDYTDVLRTFRDNDPNQNGRKDEYPLSILGPWEAKFFLHAWGLTPNDYNLYVDDAGTVQYAPFDGRYREFIAWLALLHTENLIDGEAFSTSQAGRTAQLADTANDPPVVLGSLISFAPYTLITNMDKSLEFSVLQPFAYEGKQVYRQVLNGVGRGTFAITSACDDPGALLAWVDDLYTEKGSQLAFAGKEGEDYVMGTDGFWHWTAGEDYTALQDLATNGIIASDTNTPGLEVASFMRNSEISADNYVRRQTDTIREFLVEPYPVTWPTDEAREARIVELQAALGFCVDKAIADFATGRIALTDESWQAFQDELRALGAEELTALFQAKYDEMAKAD